MTSGSGIDWPRGPYRFPPQRWAGAVLWLCALFLIGGSILVVVLLARTETIAQALADASASLSRGEAVAAARVEAVDCTRFQRRADVYHYCDVAVTGLGRPHEYEIIVDQPVTPAQAGRVTRVDGRIAVAWTGGVMFDRLFGLLVVSIVALLLIGFALFLLWQVSRPQRFAGRDVTIIDIDLLRRKMLRRGARWDYGFDHRGARLYGRETVFADPVITDGVVTRGAAFVTSDGKSALLTIVHKPLGEDPSWDRVKARVGERFHAQRNPLDERFDEVAGGASGAERDYMQAFARAWRGHDAAAVNAGIEDRHRAASSLSVERIDRLLRDCRRFIRA